MQPIEGDGLLAADAETITVVLDPLDRIPQLDELLLFDRDECRLDFVAAGKLHGIIGILLRLLLLVVDLRETLPAKRLTLLQRLNPHLEFTEELAFFGIAKLTVDVTFPG